MEHIAARLAQIPGVVAVTLGGSRARGEERPDSDWDFGLYYRETIDPGDVIALGWPGEVTGPGGWGPVVDGGAWLSIDGQRVDLCYRDLDEVLAAVVEAEAGRFRIEALATYVAGIPTYVLAGELALGKVLSGALPRPGFPDALAQSAPPRWRQLAVMAVRAAASHASRGDVVETTANMGQATICEAHARLAERRYWVLNEKGIVERAGLGDAAAVLGAPGSSPAELVASVVTVADLLGVATPHPALDAPVTGRSPFRCADVHRVLDALVAAEIGVWVDGGWGIDALLGVESRPHDDLDLVVDAGDGPRAEAVLGTLGFRYDATALPGRPARVVLRDDRRRQIDIHPVTFDTQGNGWQDLANGAWGLYDADGLGARGAIGGREVRCIGARLQLRHHLGYPPRAVDHHDLQRLARSFDLRLPPGL